MAAEQENNEPSMAEILASIRRILENGGSSGEAAVRDDEVLELTPSMMVEEGKIIAGDKPLPSAPKTADFEESASIFADVSELSGNAGAATEREKKFVGDNHIDAPAAEKPAALEAKNFPASGATDVSAEIIDSFTRMFEQNDFRRHAEKPVFDADALLRQIVASAVAERLDERMLQNLVKQTVVPVLEEWLSHYLPRLVADEVRRVMVKAGGR